MEERLGIDTEAALAFCGGEYSLYREVLFDYAETYPGKRAELDRCFDDADWHEFEVKIHALKSNSKTIGATELSEKALSLEEAAGSGKADFIRNTYPDFALAYQKIAQAIQELMESRK